MRNLFKGFNYPDVIKDIHAIKKQNTHTYNPPGKRYFFQLLPH